MAGALTRALIKDGTDRATPQQIIQTSANKIRNLTDKGMKKETFNL
jgi:hypothetical protein